MKSQSVTPKPDAQLNKWCQILAQGTAVAEEVPAGWFTVRQLAEARKRGECTVGQQVKRMVETGQAEQRMFSIRLAERVRPVPHYRLK